MFTRNSQRQNQTFSNGKGYADPVTALFNKYANDPEDKLVGTEPGKMGPNGIQNLLTDLKLDAMDRKVLILAYKMGAAVACEFSLDEWTKGMMAMNVNSVDGLRKRLDELDRSMITNSNLEPVYKFTFTYGKMLHQRNLDFDTAVVYWKILFKNQFALLPLWEEFITTKYKKAITKDAWNQTFEFATTVKSDFSNYDEFSVFSVHDEEASWPTVLDDFVQWGRPKVGRK